jgi:DNA-binding response OmpR family regulator
VADPPQTVLVVDDEIGLLEPLEAYLQNEGFRVLRATDGPTAVDSALRDDPALVLLDLNRNGTPLNLTPTEYRLLDVFTANPGGAFTRDHPIELVSTDGADVFDRTLDRHIANLRRKVEPAPQHPRYILTVFGVGYKLVEPE